MESSSMEQATQAMEIAEEKLVTGHDLSEAMKHALKARRLYPQLKGVDQLISVLEVHLAAADPNNCSGNRDYYKILQVDPQADSSRIKKQYRKIALNVHPDKNHSIGAVEAFKMVIEAFEVLSDERKRELYDRGLWSGLPEMAEVNMESLFTKIKKLREEWEETKRQMSEKDMEILRMRIKREREDWKKRTMHMSDDYFESLRRRMKQAEEGWKKNKTQKSEEDIQNSRRKMREEWQKKRSQMSEEEIERARTKIRKQKEEWEKKRAQMSQEDIEKSRRRMEKSKEEMVKKKMEREMKKAEEEKEREMRPKITFEQ